MSQVENRTYDDIKKVFEDANIYIEAFFAGDKERTKDNLILLTKNETLKSNNKTQKPKSRIKQKGDLDMKNVYYVPAEKRYTGIKQINKIRIRVHAKTQLECYNLLKEAIKDFKNSNYKSENKSKTITLKDYYLQWFEQDKKDFIVPKTQRDILHTLELLEPLHKLSIKKVDKNTILNFLNTMPKNRTKEKVILYLKAMFKNAVANRIIKYSPFDTIKTAPKIKVQKYAFTYEEQVLLLDRLKTEELRPIILIYLITGLRQSELNFRHIENDINFEQKVLKARNLKGRNFEVRYKYIRLSDSAISLIMNNLDIIHKYNADSCYRAFHKIMKELNITKSIVNLRHTFATNHLYLGTPEYIIAQEMGHSTSQITKQHYMNIDFNLNKDKILKLYNNLYSIFN